jgi:hypothetical protein
MSTARQSEPAGFLPAYLREFLGRKSSRNPNSRFPSKLLFLLRYADENPSLVNQIGLAWVSDDEFKMNKNVLVDVLGIKLNSLNVNLRDLHFTASGKESNGWTHWKGPNFTRTDSLVSLPALAESTLPMTPSPIRTGRISKSAVNFTLGRLDPLEHEPFANASQTLWWQLFAVPVTTALHPEMVVEAAARKFKHIEQPLDNAQAVIRAIIVTRQDVLVTFSDFARFLAMFGPELTVMIKIASLLTCSNETGKWLTFDSAVIPNRQLPFAQFDEKQPNCLVVHHGDQSVERVYNHPNLDANLAYVLDESGAKFGDWDAYFKQRPVRPGYNSVMF